MEPEQNEKFYVVEMNLHLFEFLTKLQKLS